MEPVRKLLFHPRGGSALAQWPVSNEPWCGSDVYSSDAYLYLFLEHDIILVSGGHETAVTVICTATRAG